MADDTTPEDDAVEPDVDVVFVLGEGGGIFKMSLPLSEPIADRLEKGYLRLVNADGSDVTSDAERIQPTGRKKSEWIGWAVHKGANPDDAEAMTVTDLVEKYGV